MPNTSPTHHDTQFGTMAAAGRTPSRYSAPTPMVAAIRQASGPATANRRNRSASRVSLIGNPNQRPISA
jgi:hypothetical protein